MNKFKFNIFTVGLAATGLLMGSCSESFLDVESKTESTTGNFYKTEGDAYRALVGCYDGWRRLSSQVGVGFYVASTVMSDECYGSTGIGDGGVYQVIDEFDLAPNPAQLNLYDQDWKLYYAGVYRCNELLVHDETIAWDETSGKRGMYIGEARTLRAMMYFDMVRLWENIPLFTEPSQENREQAAPDSVYAVIFNDLKFAVENIPADANLGTDNFGRVNKYAAEALLARAYLYYTGYYGKEPQNVTKAEALAAVEDVIASNNYKLVDDFKNLWPAASLVPIPGQVGWDNEKSTYAGNANSEIILSMNFTPTTNYYNGEATPNRWQVMMGMRNVNDKTNGYGKGWGAACVTPYYIDKYFKGDPRYAASVIDLAGEGVTKIADFETLTNDWCEYTGYTVKKYSPLVFGNGLPGTNADGTAGFQESNVQPWNIVRYADVLLMAAELGSGNAQRYLDMVRSRAGLGSIPVTKQNIMDERARELAFEGHRYWDLLRQGVDVLADALCATSGPVLSGWNAATVNYNREKIIAKRGLSQIPLNQITLSNGVLKQNPGW